MGSQIGCKINQKIPWPPEGIDWYYSDDSTCVELKYVKIAIERLKQEVLELV